MALVVFPVPPFRLMKEIILDIRKLVMHLFKSLPENFWTEPNCHAFEYHNISQTSRKVIMVDRVPKR